MVRSTILARRVEERDRSTPRFACSRRALTRFTLLCSARHLAHKLPLEPSTPTRPNSQHHAVSVPLDAPLNAPSARTNVSIRGTRSFHACPLTMSTCTLHASPLSFVSCLTPALEYGMPRQPELHVYMALDASLTAPSAAEAVTSLLLAHPPPPLLQLRLHVMPCNI